jgi:hypothetical protein
MLKVTATVGLFAAVALSASTVEACCSYSFPSYEATHGNITLTAPSVNSTVSEMASAAQNKIGDCSRSYRGRVLLDCVENALAALSNQINASNVAQREPRAAQIMRQVVQDIRIVQAAPRAPVVTTQVSVPAPTGGVTTRTVQTAPLPQKARVVSAVQRARGLAAAAATTSSADVREAYNALSSVLAQASSVLQSKG